MVRPSGGRANILAAQSVYDFQGTTLVIVAGEAGTAYKPAGAIGAMVYSPNIDLRIRHDAPASTALTNPQSGHLRAVQENTFSLNPGVNYISLTAIAAATAVISWVMGAGA